MEVVAVAKAVSSGISTLSKLLDMLKNRKDEHPFEILEVSKNTAWNVLKSVGEFQLQGNEINAVENKALKTLTKWCYNAEDIVDHKEVKAAKKNGSIAAVSEAVKKLWNKVAVPDKILDACTKINEMVMRCEKFNVNQHHDHHTTVVPHSHIGTTDAKMLDPLIGRDSNVEEIMKLLFDDRKENGVSIVGMCGIGKSSLARKIVDHTKTIKQNSLTLWVDVPNGFFVWNNIKQQVDSVFAKSVDKKEELLIVFDNLQHVGHLEWHEFQKYKKAKPIKMVITTRNPTIPNSTCTIPHELGFLSNDCCEKVIKEYASHYHDCTEHSEQHFGSAVESAVKKCEGLPYGAKMFGIIIGKCMYKNNWDAFDSVQRLWQEPGFKKEIFPMILSSSYQGMELELWRCVAYLSLFPVGHQFDLEDLVHLWVGEGFIPLEPGSSLKQIKERYIDDLLQRSIIIQQQCSEKVMQTPHSTTKVRLHCYGEEFASIASLKTCLRLDPDAQCPYAWDMNLRHLSFFNYSEINAQSGKLKKLRTFMSLNEGANNWGGLNKDIHQHYKVASHLRVLSLKRTNIEEIPEHIFNLIHLRYFDISYTSVKKLPEELSNLHALQFLKLEGCRELVLPQKFHECTNLLYVEWEESLLKKNSRVFSNIGKLYRLENLPLFVVGDNDKGCSISGLKEMNNLRGSLCISDLHKIKDSVTDTKEAQLDKKCGLKSIKLLWNTRKEVMSDPHDEAILKNLKPHENVKTLELVKYGGKMFPEWIMNSKLVDITLTRCKFFDDLFPQLAKLGSLKFLRLDYDILGTVSVLSCRFDGDERRTCFPSLESLVISNIGNIKELKELRITDMLCLKLIQIKNCRNMASLPSLSHIKTFRSLAIERSNLLKKFIENKGLMCNHDNTRVEIDGKVHHTCLKEANGST